MRRPLKPFVTEYKNSSRRAKDVFDIAAQTAVDNQPDPGSDAPRPFMPADDSHYDAAMRAADALFSGSPKTPSEPLPMTDREVAATGAAAERPAGRILQAIDETPVDPFAALEAERAPKRRGRKPGSKNKPKVVPIAASEAAPPQTPVVKPKLRPGAPVTAQAHPVVAAATVVSDTYIPREPFSWVRKRLRPGEKWKLRIPKVAW